MKTQMDLPQIPTVARALLAGVLAVSAASMSASTRTVVQPVETSDRTVMADGSMRSTGDSSTRVGNGYSASVDSVYVMPVELPTLQAGERITAATLAINLQGWHRYNEQNLQNIDLYGLGITSSSSAVTASHYVSAVNPSGYNAVLLTDNLAERADMTSNSVSNLTIAKSSGDIGGFFQDLYDDGAQGGEYAFLVLGHDTPLSVQRYFIFSTAEATGYPTPAVTFTIESGPVKPNASNTGYTGTLTSSGTLTITTQGAVIENLEITGGVHVKANNVTIRNCKIIGGLYGIRANYGYTNLLVEDCEIVESQSAGIYGSNFTARRLNVHESFGDGFKPITNVVIESCYVHHLGKADGAHADAVQSRDGGSNMLFRWNNFDLSFIEPPYKGNSAFIMQSANGQITNTIVEENWMNGGSYTYNGGSMSGITVRNNLFGRDYQYGILYPNSAPVWYGNVWEDDGTPAP